jgi:hypothetical protein
MRTTRRAIGVFLAAAALLVAPAKAHSFEFVKDSAQVAAAFMTNLAMHEVGHAAVGTFVGAEGVKTSFFARRNGAFFLGHTSYSNLRREARVPFLAGGPMMNCYTFEYALADYQRSPNTYNKALMFFSCTDFLYYSLYALYLSPGNEHYDPVALQQETGLSKEAILGVALAQTMLNAMRAYNVQSRVIPYFAVDRRYEASFNVMVRF